MPSRDQLNPNAIRAHLANKTVSHWGLAEFLGKAPQMGETYPITVDYNMTLEEMIAVGHYDWKNEDITSKNFQAVGTGKVGLDAQLIHYGKNMGSEAVLADLGQRGLRSATIAELLVFGAKYPELQRQFSIVELGSVAQIGDDRCVACLVRGDRQRCLCLSWFGHVWDADYRFLAFRKS